MHQIEGLRVEAAAIPDFDDPNIDKDAAVQGALGKFSPAESTRLKSDALVLFRG